MPVRPEPAAVPRRGAGWFTLRHLTLKIFVQFPHRVPDVGTMSNLKKISSIKSHDSSGGSEQCGVKDPAYRKTN